MNRSSPVASMSIGRGFTIVELVIVLAIIGVLAAVVFARFLDTDSFDAVIVRDQIISITRNAQQSALGRSGVTLTVQPNGIGDLLTITASDGANTIRSAELPLSGVSSLRADINKGGSCAAADGDFAITNANPLTLTFNSLGDLGASGVSGNTGSITSGVRICIDQSANNSVCVSPTGFAYAGVCDGTNN